MVHMVHMVHMVQLVHKCTTHENNLDWFGSAWSKHKCCLCLKTFIIVMFELIFDKLAACIFSGIVYNTSTCLNRKRMMQEQQGC